MCVCGGGVGGWKPSLSNVGDLPTKKHFPVKVQVGAGYDHCWSTTDTNPLWGNFREKQEIIFDKNLVSTIVGRKDTRGSRGTFMQFTWGKIQLVIPGQQRP